MSIRADLYRAYAQREGKEKALPFLLKLLGFDNDTIEQAMDEEIWRTTEEGKHFKFESTTGEIKAGFGGKLNGKRLGQPFKSQTTPKAPEKPSGGSTGSGGGNTSTPPTGGSTANAGGHSGTSGGNGHSWQQVTPPERQEPSKGAKIPVTFNNMSNEANAQKYAQRYRDAEKEAKEIFENPDSTPEQKEEAVVSMAKIASWSDAWARAATQPGAKTSDYGIDDIPKEWEARLTNQELDVLSGICEEVRPVVDYGKWAQQNPEKDNVMMALQAKLLGAEIQPEIPRNILEQYSSITERSESPGQISMFAGENVEPGKPASKVPADWMDHLLDKDKAWANQILRNGELTPGEYLNTGLSKERKNTLLNMMGIQAGWPQMMQDRDYDLLNDTEKKDINLMLEHFAPEGYADSMEHAEFVLQNTLGGPNMKYYQYLKAKALGIEGIDKVDRPEGIAYAEAHGTNRERIQAQDGGYVHTAAGDDARAEIKRSMQQNTSLFSDMNSDSEQYRDALMASVDNMDDRMAQLVASTMERSSVRWKDTPNGSYFDPNNGSIVMDTIVNGEFRSPEDMVAAFWHEYGHYVDDIYASKSDIGMVEDPFMGYYDSITPEGVTHGLNDSGEYKKAAQADIESIFNAAGLSDEYRVEPGYGNGGKLRVVRRSDNTVIDMSNPNTVDDHIKLTGAISDYLEKALGEYPGESFLVARGQPEEPKYEDYYKKYVTPKRQQVKFKERFKGAEEAYRKAVEEWSDKKEQWIESMGGVGAYFKLLKEQADAMAAYDQKKKKMSKVTDCLDEAVNGLFNLMCGWGGHEMSYYRSQQGPIETVANIFSIRSMNDPDINEFVEKVIPNIAKVTTQAWRVGK